MTKLLFSNQELLQYLDHYYHLYIMHSIFPPCPLCEITYFSAAIELTLLYTASL